MVDEIKSKKNDIVYKILRNGIKDLSKHKDECKCSMHSFLRETKKRMAKLEQLHAMGCDLCGYEHEK